MSISVPNSRALELRGPFSEVGSDVSLRIVSFLDFPDLFQFFNSNRKTRDLREKNNNQAEREAFSHIRIFDRKCWANYFGAKITNQFDAKKIDINVLRTFVKTFYGPNPIGPGRVKDACLIPTVVPQYLTVADRRVTFCLNELGKLAEHPIEGHAAKYLSCSYALRQHGEIAEGPARLRILLKDVIARNLISRKNYT